MSSPYLRVLPWECEKEEDLGSPSLDVLVDPSQACLSFCEDEEEEEGGGASEEEEWNESPVTPAPSKRSADNAAAVVAVAVVAESTP